MFRKIGAIAAADAVIKGAGFLLLPVYLGLMSKSEFGEFTYYITAIGLIVPIAALSLYVPQIREFSSSNDVRIKKVIFSSTLLVVIVLLVTILSCAYFFGISDLLFGYVFGEQKFSAEKTILIIMMVFFGAINLILYSHCMARKNTKLIIIYNAGKFLLVAIFGLGFLYIGTSYMDASIDRLIGVVIGESLTAFVMFAFFGARYFSWRIDFEYVERAFKVALPLIPAGVATLIAMMSDRYFLNLHYGAEAMAEYNLAFQVLLPVQMIMTAAQAAWAPHLFSVDNDSQAVDQTWLFLKKIFSVLVMGVFIIWLVMSMAMQYAIIPVQYKDVDVLVALMSVSVIGSALMHLPFNLFIRSGRTALVLYVSIFRALLVVLVSYLVVEDYGYFGAAIGQSLLMLFVLYVAWSLANKYRKKAI